MPASNNFRVESFVVGLAFKAPCQHLALTPITLEGVYGPYQQNDRVLAAGQSNAVDNGIYRVEGTAWVRSGDFDGNRDVVGGTIIPVDGGSGNLVLYKTDGAIADARSPGTDPMNFSFYIDPAAISEQDTLQSVTTRGDTTTENINLLTGAEMTLQSPDGNDFVFVRVVEPGAFPYLEIGQTAATAIEEIRLWHDLNLPTSDIFIGGIGNRRLAFYPRGDAVSSNITVDGATGDMTVQTVSGFFDVIGDSMEFNYQQTAGFTIIDDFGDTRFSITGNRGTGQTTIETDSGSIFRVRDDIGNRVDYTMGSAGLNMDFSGSAGTKRLRLIGTGTDQVDVERPRLLDFTIGNQTLTSTAGVVDWNYETGQSGVLTLTENVTALNLNNPPGVNQLAQLELELNQDATTAFTVAWPASIVWVNNGTEPDITTLSSLTLISLRSRDGGVTWLGNYGENYG